MKAKFILLITFPVLFSCSNKKMITVNDIVSEISKKNKIDIEAVDAMSPDVPTLTFKVSN